MNEYLMLMHGDTVSPPAADAWAGYLDGLRSRRVFDGGSAIGAGRAFRMSGNPAGISAGITGYVRVRANNLGEAQALLVGNPVWECGGTVEIRELPRG